MEMIFAWEPKKFKSYIMSEMLSVKLYPGIKLEDRRIRAQVRGHS